MKKLIMFYGQECPHCHAMLPLADKLVSEEDVEVKKLEVWHDDSNAEKMRDYKDVIKSACGGEFGVPAFVDVEKKKAFCGETSYEELKEWALQN